MLLFGLAAILILFTVLWVVSLRLENSSVAEVAWSPAILVIGLTYYFTSDGGTIRAYVTLALLALWAARLSVHLGMRTRLQGEDFRYVKWRDDYDPWWLVSYFKVFLFQAVAAWLVSLPIYFAVVSPAPASLTLTDYFGILLVVCGLASRRLVMSNCDASAPTAPIAAKCSTRACGSTRGIQTISAKRCCGGDLASSALPPAVCPALLVPRYSLTC